ncbi:hypothetical protein DIPPA_16408 [Diplonema papillatum]|nr:hypothetical protein DIPPA_16408 [Diplonema papillatum]
MGSLSISSRVKPTCLTTTPAEIALLGRQLSSERAASCSPSPRFARAARQSVESARGPSEASVGAASSGTAASSRARYRPKDHAGILSYADTSPFLWTRQQRAANTGD